MSEAQKQSGIRSLYEDPDLRDELIDEEAQVLLKWGEEQVARLAEQGMDSPAFDEAMQQLQRLIKRINRLTSRRSYLNPEENQELLDKIKESAQAVNLQPPPASATVQAVDDNIAFLKSFTNALTGTLINAAITSDSTQAASSAEKPAGLDGIFQSITDAMFPPQEPSSGSTSTGEAKINDEEK